MPWRTSTRTLRVTWLIRFRFDGRQYYRSLDTTDETEARGIKALVEETLSLLKRDRLSLPGGTGSDEAALFIISGGNIVEQPKVASTAKTLKQASDNYFDELKGKKVQPETIKKELATFGLIWNFARARKWVDGEVNRKQIRLPKSSVTAYDRCVLPLCNIHSSAARGSECMELDSPSAGGRLHLRAKLHVAKFRGGWHLRALGLMRN